jgi:uncharacterized protein YodC (DUF2158 family)
MANAQSDPKWQIGDLVRLASGGPLMVVASQVPPEPNYRPAVVCEWFTADGIPHKGEFVSATLVAGQTPPAKSD